MILLFGTEFIKWLMMDYNRDSDFWTFKSKGKLGKIKIKMKWFVLLFSTILFPIMVLIENNGAYPLGQILLKLFITYSITTSFYQIIFNPLVNKLKEILIMLSKANVVQKEIDLSVPDLATPTPKTETSESEING